MDSEFVNVFIEKQREVINDLTSRNIMLETRVAVAESKLNTGVPQLIAENEELKKKNQELQVLIDSSRKVISDFAAKAVKVAKDTNLT